MNKLNTDSNGFIISANRKDWKEASASWTDIRRDVAVMRSILERGGRGASRGGAETAHAAQRTSRSNASYQMGGQRSTATPSRRGVSGWHPAHATPSHPLNRDAHGRFVGGAGPKDHGKGKEKPEGGRESDTSDAARELKEAAKALGEAGDLAAHVDPAAAAAKEVGEVLQPIGRGFAKLFGIGGDGKKMAWYKKMYARLGEMTKYLKDAAAIRMPAGGAGAMGILGRLFSGGAASEVAEGAAGATLFGRLKGAFKGGAGRMAAAGGGLLKGAAGAGRTALRRFAPLAALLDIGEGVGNDYLIRHDSNLTDQDRSDKRLSNVGATGTKLGGHIAGAAAGAALGATIGSVVPIIGTAVGGVIGGILGGVFGPDLLKKLAEILSPLIGDAVDFIRDSSKKISDLYDAAVQAVSDKIEQIANSKPVQTVHRAYQKVVDATSSGIEGATKGFNTVKNAFDFSGGSSLRGLNDSQTSAYAANVAKTESGGRVGTENSYGYVGQYQFGADALADQGFVDKGKLAAAKKAAGKSWFSGGFHKAFVDDPSNWNTQGGKAAFLMDKKAQDQAFIKYTNANIAAGMKSGAISSSSSPEQIAAYAKAAHLKGSAAADNLFLRGVDSTDAYGTSASSYAAQAAAAVSAAPTVAASALGATPSSPTVPSMPAMPDAPKIARASTTTVASNAGASAGPPQDVGQDMRDRTIGHAATGGIGGG